MLCRGDGRQRRVRQQPGLASELSRASCASSTSGRPRWAGAEFDAARARPWRRCGGLVGRSRRPERSAPDSPGGGRAAAVQASAEGPAAACLSWSSAPVCASADPRSSRRRAGSGPGRSRSEAGVIAPAAAPGRRDLLHEADPAKPRSAPRSVGTQDQAARRGRPHPGRTRADRRVATGPHCHGAAVAMLTGGPPDPCLCGPSVRYSIAPARSIAPWTPLARLPE